MTHSRSGSLNEHEGTHHGGFQVEYSNGYATLTVYPPDENARAIYAEDVINRMKLLGVPRVSVTTIGKIISEAKGKPVKMVEWPDGERLSASIEITINNDALEASVIMQAPKKGGGRRSVEEITAALEERGVRFGINREEIERIIKSEKYGESVVVAKARNKRDGEPSRVEFSFETDVGRPYLVLAGGRIDLKELNFIQNKKQGEVLGTIIPAKPPVDGVDLFGKTIPASPAGESTAVRPGRNTAYSEDGTRILSLIDGNAFLKSGAVHVEPVVTVKNVNYETGNIDFGGSVVIQEGIADGFRVKAGGSIEIGECVGRVEIVSARDILLKGGMNGAGEGSVSADGEIYAKHLESTSISCRGNLIVDEVAMRSDIYVSSHLLLKGKRADIIGGNTVVGGSLWCKEIGSASEVATRVSIGVDPITYKTFLDLLAEIENKSDNFDELRMNIEKLKKHGSNDAAKAAKTKQALAQLRDEAKKMEEDLKERVLQVKSRRRSMKPEKKSILVVEEKMHPKTVIAFGSEEFHVPNRGSDRTILRVLDNKIVESGFNPAEPPHFPLTPETSSPTTKGGKKRGR